MRAGLAFVSCGVNRVVNAVDWGDGGLVAYAGHRMVCIYDPQRAEVVGTLTGHKGVVNCIKWLPAAANPAGAALLLSGAADGAVRIWAWRGQQHSPPWQCLGELQGHQSPVTCLALHSMPQQQLLLASTSADAVVRLWLLQGSHAAQQQQQPAHAAAAAAAAAAEALQRQFGAGAWQQQAPVAVGTRMQHCVALAALPGDPACVLMATGGTDSIIRLFVSAGSSGSSHDGANGQCAAAASGQEQAQQQQLLPPFELQCQLRGHDNWIKGLALTCVCEDGPGPAGSTACQQQQQQQGSGRLSLLLASAGQDRYGRIWCISTHGTRGSAADAGSTGSDDDALKSLITRYAPRPHLSANSQTYWVTLDALLIGHEDWLNSVTWRPQPAGSTGGPPAKRDATLLSSSQDRSMILWGYDSPSRLWMNEALIGDAGASCLGFYGGCFSPDGNSLVAHGFTGALHLWQQQQQAPVAANGGGSGGSSGCRKRRLWVPQHALGGHYGGVHDLCWGGDGGCLQSVAADQTARLFTAVRAHWFELARTQVHGHNFSCLAAIPSSSSSSSGGSQTASALQPACLHYVSGSEEKVLRVFEAPQAFIESLTAVRQSQSREAAAATAAAFAAAGQGTGGGGSGSARNSVALLQQQQGRALGASVAALGLSNKAVYARDFGGAGGEDGMDAGGAGCGRGVVGAEAYTEGPDFVPAAAPAVVHGPPLEEHLAQNTLWPEVHKLYGHGNDVFCVAASPRGTLLASACKAQSAGAAGVWVWEVGSWRPVAQLPGHTLTVTQLAFSPDGAHLLSGSRDRSFSVWRVPAQFCCGAGSAAAAGSHAAAAAGTGSSSSDSSSGGFELVGRLKAAHSRIIWGVAWSPDGRLFSTGSRDQSVKLWALADMGGSSSSSSSSSSSVPQRPVLSLPPFPAGVTAVALTAAAAGGSCARQQQQQQWLLAVGLEDGSLSVWRVTVVTAADAQAQPTGHSSSAERLWSSQPWEQHAAAVKRLAWGPPGCVQALCGSGGDDGRQPSGAADTAGAAGVDAASAAPRHHTMHLASCGEDHSVRVFALCDGP